MIPFHSITKPTQDRGTRMPRIARERSFKVQVKHKKVNAFIGKHSTQQAKQAAGECQWKASGECELWKDPWFGEKSLSFPSSASRNAALHLPNIHLTMVRPPEDDGPNCVIGDQGNAHIVTIDSEKV